MAVIMMYFAFAKAQSPSTLPIKKDILKAPEYYYIDGDSVNAIELEQVMLLQPLNFDHKYEKIKYQYLQRKVRNVWPYATMAAERLVKLNERLERLKYKRDKKRYTKRVQDYLEKELKADLKKLNKTEGKILIKLIHRQTGVTAFNLMKELRSGWNAFWMNNTARLFDLDLKATYNPETEIQDFYVEDILLNSFKRETLKEQAPAISYDYYKGRDNWNTYKDALPADYDSINLAARSQRIKEYNAKKQQERERERKKVARKTKREASRKK